jgi:uncharacterized protein (TIRG00374 family)
MATGYAAFLLLNFIKYNCLVMRKFVFAILLLLCIVFIFLNLGEMQSIYQTLLQANLYFLFVALALEIVFMFLVAGQYRSVYASLGMKEGLFRMLALVMAGGFVNVVAPAGGMGMLATFLADAKLHGRSTARVTVAGGVVVFFDYISFLAILILGLIVLFRRNNLAALELAASGLLVFGIFMLGGLIFLGMHSGQALGKVLAWMARQANRFIWLFIHRAYFSEARAHSFAAEASSGLVRIRQEPKNLILPFMLSALGRLLQILILMLVFLDFRIPFSAGTLIGGYSIGYLFAIVSPTPAGIGIVEGALTIGLRSLNVPLEQATIVTLAYRAVTFWTPFMVGMFAVRWLTHGDRSRVLQDEDRGS